MIAIDTNVIAYLLIEGDRTAEVQAPRPTDPDWRSEPFLLFEFSNLPATRVGTKALAVAQAKSLLESAAQQVAAWVEVRHVEALAVALDRQVSAYDARLVACARRLSAPLVAEDSRLRAATPGSSMSIAEALSRSAG
jgi:predicted nucleic acid-binding protein